MKYKRKKAITYWLYSIVLLLLFNILPALGIIRSFEILDFRITLGYLAIISIITAITSISDKANAKTGDWRTPESTLHTLELLGGWVAAFLTQRVIRHKTSKGSYQMSFWFITIFHNALAFDYLNDWRYSKLIFHTLSQLKSAHS